MKDKTNSKSLNGLFPSLSKAKPFCYIDNKSLQNWLLESRLLEFSPGERVLRPDELNSSVYVAISGYSRLIANATDGNGQISLGKRGPGQLFGWVSLLRADPCEFVQASTDLTLLALPSTVFIDLYLSNSKFADYFNSLVSTHESFFIAQEAARLNSYQPFDLQEYAVQCSGIATVATLSSGSVFRDLPTIDKNWNWYLSSPHHNRFPAASQVGVDFEILPDDLNSFKLPLRFIALPNPPDIDTKETFPNQLSTSTSVDNIAQLPEPLDLEQLGIIEADQNTEDGKYPLVKAVGKVPEALAVCEMLCLQLNVPFRRDSVEKVLKDNQRRGKDPSLEIFAGLFELLGLSTQLAEVNIDYATNIEFPALIIYDQSPCIFHGYKSKTVTLAHPRDGIVDIPFNVFVNSYSEKLRFVLPKRSRSTPTSTFGWSWFTPL